VHGAEIEVESRLQAGSSIRVRFTRRSSTGSAVDALERTASVGPAKPMDASKPIEASPRVSGLTPEGKIL